MFRCRCGFEGIENIAVLPPELIVKCRRCGWLSHVSFQKNGKASTPKGAENFQCDFCLPLISHRSKKRKKLKQVPDSAPRTSLSKCLKPGKGALARVGNYWYPARLIMKQSDSWTLKWWRGCQSPTSEDGPMIWPSVKVAEVDICDELWANPSARRKIRLGKWTLSCETMDDGDIMADFRDTPYTPEIEAALRPHIHCLTSLLEEPDNDHWAIPAARFAREHAQSRRALEFLRNGGIPFHGSLSVTDRARVMNWFYHCVDNAKDKFLAWVGRVPIGHAYTILIAAQKKAKILAEIASNEQMASQDKQTAIFNVAWEYQMKDNTTANVVDVDLDCVAFLEERMFENSIQAGRAGNEQWGRDAGPHQDGWVPYMHIPSHWNHGDREGSETELQVQNIGKTKRT
ncbi:hypothetical protein C8J57DRAFT_1236007 [Mycena rebaudengoi]|nr:hypothetical protein C8J57DRAFT_1236007 [Mycena rebaudengoi]